MKMRKKSDLPTKVCLRCGLPFSWRKKWERDWETVKYCSDRCRSGPALQRFSCRLITSGAADFVRGQGEAEGWPLWPDRAFDAGIGRKTKPGGDPTDVRSAVWIETPTKTS
jgi:hypothetical protein